jgi:hypothetical protein
MDIPEEGLYVYDAPREPSVEPFHDGSLAKPPFIDDDSDALTSGSLPYCSDLREMFFWSIWFFDKSVDVFCATEYFIAFDSVKILSCENTYPHISAITDTIFTFMNYQFFPEKKLSDSCLSNV